MEWLLTPELPGATVAIMLISFCISLINSSVNRILINLTVGWKQYKVIQKETAEFQAQSRQALRTKDKKILEKLKKKEPQILQNQKKIVKPQMIMTGLSFSYLFIWWFLLIPFYDWKTVAYIPGIGGVNVIWWYFICSLFFQVISSHLLGIMSIE